MGYEKNKKLIKVPSFSSPSGNQTPVYIPTNHREPVFQKDLFGVETKRSREVTRLTYGVGGEHRLSCVLGKEIRETIHRYLRWIFRVKPIFFFRKVSISLRQCFCFRGA